MKEKYKYSEDKELTADERIKHFTFCVARTKDYGWARTKFAELKERLKPDVHIYNVLLKMAPKPELEVILAEMKADNVKADVATYNTLAGHQGSTLKHALQMLALIKKNGLEPDAHSYRLLIHRLLESPREQDHKLALTHFERMRASGPQPDCVTYNNIISHYQRVNNMERALEAAIDLHSRKEIKRDYVTYILLCKTFAFNKELGLVNEVQTEMAEKGIKPSGIFFVHQIHYHMREKSDESEIQKLIKIFNREQLWSTNICTALIQYYNAVEKPEKALDIEAVMRSKKIVRDTFCLNCLIVSYSMLEDEESILNIFDSMDRLAQSPNIFTFNHILKYYVDRGDARSVMDWKLKLDRYPHCTPTQGTERLLARANRMMSEGVY